MKATLANTFPLLSAISLGATESALGFFPIGWSIGGQPVSQQEMLHFVTRLAADPNPPLVADVHETAFGIMHWRLN